MKKLFFMGFALLLCAMWPADAAAQLKRGTKLFIWYEYKTI